MIKTDNHKPSIPSWKWLSDYQKCIILYGNIWDLWYLFKACTRPLNLYIIIRTATFIFLCFFCNSNIEMALQAEWARLWRSQSQLFCSKRFSRYQVREMSDVCLLKLPPRSLDLNSIRQNWETLEYEVQIRHANILTHLNDLGTFLTKVYYVILSKNFLKLPESMLVKWHSLSEGAATRY